MIKISSKPVSEYSLRRFIERNNLNPKGIIVIRSFDINSEGAVLRNRTVTAYLPNGEIKTYGKNMEELKGELEMDIKQVGLGIKQINGQTLEVI